MGSLSCFFCSLACVSKLVRVGAYCVILCGIFWVSAGRPEIWFTPLRALWLAPHVRGVGVYAFRCLLLFVGFFCVGRGGRFRGGLLSDQGACVSNQLLLFVFAPVCNCACALQCDRPFSGVVASALYGVIQARTHRERQVAYWTIRRLIGGLVRSIFSCFCEAVWVLRARCP